MRIDYCPKCNKAGLKWDSLDASSSPPHPGQDKWCPRCKEWVKPVNKPYKGGPN
jgi:hypothetical protein